MDAKILLFAVIATIAISGCVAGLSANANEKAVADIARTSLAGKTASATQIQFKAGDTIDLDIVAVAAGMKPEKLVKGTCAANNVGQSTDILSGCGGRKITVPADLNIYIGIDCEPASGASNACSIDFCTENKAWCAIKQKVWAALSVK